MLRKAVVDDSSIVRQLHNDILKRNFTEEYAKKVIEDTLGGVYVYEISNEIIGFVSYRREKEIVNNQFKEVGYIINLAVKEEHRGKRIGYQLLDEGCKQLHQMGYNEIRLHTQSTNVTAQKLYEKYGFVFVENRKGYYWKTKEDGYEYLYTFK